MAQEAEIKDQSFSQSLTPSIQSVNLSTTLLSLFLAFFSLFLVVSDRDTSVNDIGFARYGGSFAV